MKSKISAISSYRPERVVTNDDLSKIVDTSHDWIVQRTGIHERRIASKSELCSDLAYNAIMNMVSYYGDSILNGIDSIIFATCTPDKAFPSTALILQKKLQEKGYLNHLTQSFDINAACSGFVYGLQVANSFVQTGVSNKALLIGADLMSSIVNWKDRSTCVLFGDGAGAAIIEQSIDPISCIEGINIQGDSRYADSLTTEFNVDDKRQYIAMDGQIVFKNAVKRMTESIESIMLKHNVSIEDISYIVPHQANKRIIDSVANGLKVSKDKVVYTISENGNTSSASIPISIDYACKKDIGSGKLAIFTSMGAGFTWGSALVRL